MNRENTDIKYELISYDGFIGSKEFDFDKAITESIKRAEKSVEAMKVARKSMLKYNSSFAEGV